MFIDYLSLLISFLESRRNHTWLCREAYCVSDTRFMLHLIAKGGQLSITLLPCELLCLQWSCWAVYSLIPYSDCNREMLSSAEWICFYVVCQHNRVPVYIPRIRTGVCWAPMTELKWILKSHKFGNCIEQKQTVSCKCSRHGNRKYFFDFSTCTGKLK